MRIDGYYSLAQLIYYMLLLLKITMGFGCLWMSWGLQTNKHRLGRTTQQWVRRVGHGECMQLPQGCNLRYTKRKAHTYWFSNFGDEKQLVSFPKQYLATVQQEHMATQPLQIRTCQMKLRFQDVSSNKRNYQFYQGKTNAKSMGILDWLKMTAQDHHLRSHIPGI